MDFYSKNKFEKLVHVVGFVIRIYHDARSPECQIRHILFGWYVKEGQMGGAWGTQGKEVRAVLA